MRSIACRQVDAPLLGTVLNRYESKGNTNYTYGYPTQPSDEPTGDRSTMATQTTLDESEGLNWATETPTDDTEVVDSGRQAP